MGRFSLGQIVLAYFSDGAGRTKERPCVVLSSNAWNDSGEPLQVLAITGVFVEPLPSYHVPLPWSPGSTGVTGLNKPCVVKVNWLREVEQRNVLRSVGYLPAALLERLVDEFDRLYEDESFTDGV